MFQPCPRHVGDQDYFNQLVPWMADEQNVRNVFDWLRQRDLSSYLDAKGRLNMGEFQRRRYISETYRELQRLCAPDMDGWLDHMARLVVYGDRNGAFPWENVDDEYGNPVAHSYAAVLAKPSGTDTAAWSPGDGVRSEDLWDLYRKFLEAIKTPYPKEDLKSFRTSFGTRVQKKAWCSKGRGGGDRSRKFMFYTVGLVKDRLAKDPDALKLLSDHVQ